ncbi:unnamed protein product [Musa acuminata var. zebrina]
MSHFEKQRSPEVVASSAVAGKTARACDGCARRRARWYCPADDAFLCQNCDFSVHSANPLARRHRRVRLRAADVDSEESSPSWLRGFKRKARTPRAHQHEKTTSGARRLRPTTVPELIETSVDETEEEEEQLLYCVPVVDPALAEFCSPPMLDDSNTCSGDETKPTMDSTDGTPASTSTVDTANRLAPFLPSVTDLAEFAADMESLLGGGLDARDGSFSMEKLGLVNSMEDNVDYCLDSAGRLKTEQPDDTEQCPVELDIDKSSETLELDLDWPGSSTAKEEELEEENMEVASEQQQVTKKAKLRLDYEAVISAWSSYGSSPWTDGERPQINLDYYWPDYMGVRVEVGGGGGRGETPGTGHGSDTGVGFVDVGRQARVTRYREKRRTRLFAKKIRYEVRKLNAEKRPRMKGRFVKRAPGSAFAH